MASGKTPHTTLPLHTKNNLITRAQQKVSGTAGLTTDLGHALAWMVPRMLDAMRILHQYPYIFQLWMSCLIKLL
ncbi:hypothetical protein WJX79_000971 [Trebouxia sp. C0005]